MVTPRTLRGGILLLDPATGAVQKVIALQFNPDTVTRTLEVQSSTEKKGEPLRLKGVAVETLKVEAELDGSDMLTGQGDPDSNVSIHPQLAALEGLVQPSYATLVSNDRLANLGVMVILPAEAPLAVFVWGRKRVVPVRVIELSVAEQAFDIRLNPIRAHVTLGLRVLTVDDFGFDTIGGRVAMSHLQQTETLAKQAASAPISTLGITGVL